MISLAVPAVSLDVFADQEVMPLQFPPPSRHDHHLPLAGAMLEADSIQPRPLTMLGLGGRKP